MTAIRTTELTDMIDRVCIPLHGDDGDYDDLLDAVGHRSFVLFGEATHGTHEFYRERARITRRLIEECGFTAVAIEGDWPDAYRVNRYVTDRSDDDTAEQAMADFRRFPAWMWRNREMVDFVEWLRVHNSSIEAKERVRFYGLDLYRVSSWNLRDMHMSETLDALHEFLTVELGRSKIVVWEHNSQPPRPSPQESESAVTP